MSEVTITKEELDAVHKDVKLLREEVEKKNAESADSREKIDKINVSLDEAEKKNEVLSNAQAKTDGLMSEFLELKESIASGEADFLKEGKEAAKRVAELEVEMARNESKGLKKDEDWHETKSYEAFETFCRVGADPSALQGWAAKSQARDGAAEEWKALLRTDVNTQGGFLTSLEFDTQMIKFITEISNVRSIASVRSTTEKVMEIAVRTALGEAFYEGEAEAAQEANSTYGVETMHTYRLTATTSATLDQLMNSVFNMETEIMGDTSTFFAEKEGNKFVLGTGVKQPEGFLTNTDVEVILSGVDGEYTAENILDIQGQVKVGYNPRFVWNRQTLAVLRQLRGTTNDHFLWSPALDGPAANMLAGSPYTILQDMPVIATDSNSIAYGDFARGYRIIDRTGMSIVRDEVTLASTASVKFTFHRWNNGQVVNAEAIKILQAAAP